MFDLTVKIVRLSIATILLFVFIDPYLSMGIDDVMNQKTSEDRFRRVVVAFVATRLFGTIMAQLLFIPAATLVKRVALMI